jgi:hypothetical protein
MNLERRALERWAKGEIAGYIEIAAPEITYFDTGTQKRVNGLGAFQR